MIAPFRASLGAYLAVWASRAANALLDFTRDRIEKPLEELDAVCVAYMKRYLKLYGGGNG